MFLIIGFIVICVFIVGSIAVIVMDQVSKRRRTKELQANHIREYENLVRVVELTEIGDFSDPHHYIFYSQNHEKYTRLTVEDPDLHVRWLRAKDAFHDHNEYERRVDQFKQKVALLEQSEVGSIDALHCLIDLYEGAMYYRPNVFQRLCSEHGLPYRAPEELRQTINDAAKQQYDKLVVTAEDNAEDFLQLELLLQLADQFTRFGYGLLLPATYPERWNWWVVKYYDDPPLESFHCPSDEQKAWKFITQRLIDAVESEDLIECGVVLAHCHAYPQKRLMVGDVLYAEVAHAFVELKARAFDLASEA